MSQVDNGLIDLQKNDGIGRGLFTEMIYGEKENRRTLMTKPPTGHESSAV
jgi:hypothetical protein